MAKTADNLNDGGLEVQLPFGPPPILPEVGKQLKEYLLCPERLPIHDYRQSQKFWGRTLNPASLFEYGHSPLGTTLKADRDPATGRLLEFREVKIDELGYTAKNSLSLRRAPGEPTDGVRGSSNNFPFLPGGFDEQSLDDLIPQNDAAVDFENDLLGIPPDFREGIVFKADGKTPVTDNGPKPDLTESETVAVENAENETVVVEKAPVVNLMNLVQQEQSLVDLWKETAEDKKKESKRVAVASVNAGLNIDDTDVMDSLVDNIPVLKITEPLQKKAKRSLQWAEEIDTSSPVSNFSTQVPNMAHHFPFELDTFQKQAIIKLEEHANVFVAAHTSAGKTVVAEYAIALSKKHMTRTIYTSPIKALSNQKFRDFKKTFRSDKEEPEVGLITGDIQINQTASCLIMTTEILKSMLYCGSDVIRDLEYVIFDEVHYINDAERGHVWEEVLILLPSYVSIVMLSATVPNTLEFADWVGRTKQKKMFVISTLKRPVPLQHYLYTGFGGKSKNERFLILQPGDNKIQKKGYEDAVAAKASRQSSVKNQFGPKGGRQRLTPKQEVTLWVGFLDHLKAEDKLPVVAFTLSRNRCDSNSEALTSVDLTTGSEKSHIHHFFKDCLERLKEPDRVLPQVVKMQGLLSRGIGVHHSGILPILKEIVEILFQSGHVKLLFATETFAMGVNMPARTVVFDSIRKFDGSEMRTLHPAEYIQMAGRAGRRGIDSTGTVVIVCKGDVPAMAELENMMLGKPEVLASQFRLTYSMILNLLRVQVSNMSVEGMMCRSFMEVVHQRNMDDNKEKFKRVEEEIREINTEIPPNSQNEQLADYFHNASQFLDIWGKIRTTVLGQKRALLTVGRILLVNHKEHINKLALLLSTEASKTGSSYKVLILNNSPKGEAVENSDEIQLSVKAKEDVEKGEKKQTLSDSWYKMLSFAKPLFEPDTSGNHCIVTISQLDIFEIAAITIKTTADLVVKDWEQRQIPRFRDKPVGQTCSEAVQELTRVTHGAIASPETLPFVDVTKDMAVKDADTLRNVNRLNLLKKRLGEDQCTSMANFEQNFMHVFNVKQLEKRRDTLKFLQSPESMQLFAEYQNRINVLQQLDYITVNNTIDMKGRVACNVGNHELMITELVFRNMLIGLQPAEIAALLSCLVFQQRTNVKPEVTDSLKKAMDSVVQLADEIRGVERGFNVAQHEASEFGSLNFGLVQVVYEWAKEKPFAQIMELTDVQEGIIVRCIQQLNETLQDLKEAAIIIGNPVLRQKMEEASDAIKRDIVFAASLYTVD